MSASRGLEHRASATWEIKHRLYRAANRHDLHHVLECYAPDAVLVTPAGVAEGLDEIGWYYEHFFKGFPDYHVTAWVEFDFDNPAITEWTLTGTHIGPFLLPDGREAQGTGRHITIRGSCAAHVMDDKILTHRGYFDQLELYSQLGYGLSELDGHPPPRPAGSWLSRLFRGRP